MSTNYVYGTGRRKTAVARVRLLPGDGGIVVNGKPLTEYFGTGAPTADVSLPFRVTETEGRYGASILVAGGASPARLARSVTGSRGRSCQPIPMRAARCARLAS